MFKTILSTTAIAVIFSASVHAANIKPHHQELLTMDNGKVDCFACHTKGEKFQAPDEQACIDCHGSTQKLADLTTREHQAHGIEPNPHDSIHYGQDLACSYCHKEHQASVIYCNHCHEFKYPEMKK